jgi:uncharacterized protein (TIGR02646 family)
MVNIQKGSPPVSLQAYRSHPAAVYDGQNFTPVKADLRVALVKEQHGLCAYCMRRIRPNEREMKIEHWQCQEKYPERQLDYTNLLGACLGHEGSPREGQTCDTRKANEDIRYNPAESAHNVFGKISYSSGDGAILSNDTVFDRQIGDQKQPERRDNGSILNLNLPLLKANRLHAIRGVQIALAKPKRHQTVAEIDSMIRKIEQMPEWPEYAGVTLYFLQKRKRRG